MSHLAQTRKLVFVIGAETRILASEGDYRQALDRCLTLRKISHHIGDETLISLLVAKSLEKMADNHIQYLLGDMPQDLQTLAWLKNQLAIIEIRPLSSKATSKYERELSLEHMHLDKLKELMEIVTGKPLAPDSKEAEQLRNVDQALLDKNRDYYINHMDALQTILSTPMTYEKAYTELKKLNEQLKKEVAENTAATITSMVAPAYQKIYNIETRENTFSNAVRAAVEIYITKVKTGP